MSNERRPVISVVIPARDASATIGQCLGALAGQSLPSADYEVIAVVDGRSRDATAQIARAHGAKLIEVRRGPAGARNAGIRVARGHWVAMTDSDCIPSRGWLKSFLAALSAGEGEAEVLGAAGPTIGLESTTAAARFVDLTGGLQAERHLAHERYPWAPTSNVAYRREALLAVGGFDARFDSYEGCDLHTRLVRGAGGQFVYAAHAVVHHRHRAGWRAYWRQQLGYGRGYAQFFLRYADELTWGLGHEARAWLALAAAGARAAVPGGGDAALVRRGTFVKGLAQRIGFVRTYWSRREAARWRRPAGRPVPTAS